jgi:hypothetical protein
MGGATAPRLAMEMEQGWSGRAGWSSRDGDARSVLRAERFARR